MGGARVADIRFHVRATLCRRLERIPDGTLLALGIDLGRSLPLSDGLFVSFSRRSGRLA
jgi:hypothetical protein